MPQQAARVNIPASTRPAEPFLGKPPKDAATALASFDRKVRSGTLAQFLDIFDWSYGFGFAANDCEVLDSDHETRLSSDDVWSIDADNCYGRSSGTIRRAPVFSTER